MGDWSFFYSEKQRKLDYLICHKSIRFKLQKDQRENEEVKKKQTLRKKTIAGRKNTFQVK